MERTRRKWHGAARVKRNGGCLGIGAVLTPGVARRRERARAGDTRPIGGQRTRISGIAATRASGSIFTSVRPSALPTPACRLALALETSDPKRETSHAREEARTRVQVARIPHAPCIRARRHPSPKHRPRRTSTTTTSLAERTIAVVRARCRVADCGSRAIGRYLGRVFGPPSPRPGNSTFSVVGESRVSFLTAGDFLIFQ